MCARENGDRIFIEGIGWDCFYYDYDIRRGDTIHFRYNYKDLLMYMSPIHPNGEPKVIITDVFDEEERPVAYDNGFNLIQRQVNNMRTLVQTYEDYPAQVHCFTTANIYGNYLVIHRPIVGSLGLQQYGLLLLEMSRQTHQST
ncbi:hypothetical protein CFC21_040648 [Triticum aestivum]|uniref:TF-B3 domain-containing protein n=2 Tax=Triticum aestivum TaxID=4565 RepID=A0A3B6FMQ4_WHEAT|nr:hypothetical protein CFC21_040648 [Triticum aestivum]